MGPGSTWSSTEPSAVARTRANGLGVLAADDEVHSGDECEASAGVAGAGEETPVVLHPLEVHPEVEVHRCLRIDRNGGQTGVNSYSAGLSLESVRNGGVSRNAPPSRDFIGKYAPRDSNPEPAD
jgi:hypothetical protein